MRRVLDTDIAGIDRGVGHLAVIFQVLHKSVEFIRRNPGRDIHISACSVPGRCRPVPVIPIGIIIGRDFFLYEAAVFGDLFVNTPGRFLILQRLQRDAPGVDDLAAGGLAALRGRTVRIRSAGAPGGSFAYIR